MNVQWKIKSTCFNYEMLTGYEELIGMHIPDSNIHGVNMGPTWGPVGPQVGPMLAPWTLLSGMMS